MELSLNGLVQGAIPGPVVGMIGYDVFARAVVDFPRIASTTLTPSAATLAKATPRQSTRRQPEVASAYSPEIVLSPLTSDAKAMAKVPEDVSIRLWRSLPSDVTPKLAAELKSFTSCVWTQLHLVRQCHNR